MPGNGCDFIELSDEDCEMLQCLCENPLAIDRLSTMPPPKPFFGKVSGAPRNAILMSIHRHGRRAPVAAHKISGGMHHRDLVTHIPSVPAPRSYRSVHNRMIGLEISTSERSLAGEDKEKLCKVIAEFDHLLGSILS